MQYSYTLTDNVSHRLCHTLSVTFKINCLAIARVPIHKRWYQNSEKPPQNFFSTITRGALTLDLLSLRSAQFFLCIPSSLVRWRFCVTDPDPVQLALNGQYILLTCVWPNRDSTYIFRFFLLSPQKTYSREVQKGARPEKCVWDGSEDFPIVTIDCIRLCWSETFSALRRWLGGKANGSADERKWHGWRMQSRQPG